MWRDEGGASCPHGVGCVGDGHPRAGGSDGHRVHRLPNHKVLKIRLGLVNNSILFYASSCFAIKDQYKEVCFYKYIIKVFVSVVSKGVLGPWRPT